MRAYTVHQGYLDIGLVNFSRSLTARGLANKFDDPDWLSCDSSNQKRVSSLAEGNNYSHDIEDLWSAAHNVFGL